MGDLAPRRRTAAVNGAGVHVALRPGLVLRPQAPERRAPGARLGLALGLALRPVVAHRLQLAGLVRVRRRALAPGPAVVVARRRK